MIVGLGCDIVKVERIQTILNNYNDAFLAKIFSVSEQNDINRISDNVQKKACKAAKYFAAKEAFSKALGTGFSSGIKWNEVEVWHDEHGKPLLKISGKALEILEKLVEGKKVGLHLSLSDDYPYAQAVVIIEICYC